MYLLCITQIIVRDQILRISPGWLGPSHSSQTAPGGVRARAQWRERGEGGRGGQRAVGARVRINPAHANVLIALSRRRDGQETAKEDMVRRTSIEKDEL